MEQLQEQCCKEQRCYQTVNAAMDKAVEEVRSKLTNLDVEYPALAKQLRKTKEHSMSNFSSEFIEAEFRRSFGGPSFNGGMSGGIGGLMPTTKAPADAADSGE